MDPQAALRAWTAGESLSLAEAEGLMDCLASGEVPEGLIGGLLVASRQKGYAAEELAGFALSMRRHAVAIPHSVPEVIDTCGTGGGPSTINLSTGAAIVAAAAGAKVAKHGNRSVTSICGSADVLEALGVPIDLDPERHAAALHEVGLAFLFAPLLHPAMKAVGPVRRSLGVRTIFNVLGPLANPAGAKRQVVGVYDIDLLEPVASALALLGTERAYVVHASEGFDEVSALGITHYRRVEGSKVTTGEWSPETFGIRTTLDRDWLNSAESVKENADKLYKTLDSQSLAEYLIPNAGVALALAGVVDHVSDGAALARETIRSGKAIQKLEDMRRFR